MSYVVCSDGPLGPNTPYVYDDSGCPVAVAIMDLDKATRQEWLNLRKWGLGGSDLGVLMGADSYKSLDEMNLTKGPAGVTSEFDNPAMMWGRLLEAPVAQGYAIASNERVVRFPYMLQSLEVRCMLANVDYLIVGTFDYTRGEISDLNPNTSTEIKSVLEIKTTGITGRPNSLAKGIIPKTYEAQVLHYCTTLGINHYTLAALCGGSGLHVLQGEFVGAEIIKAMDAAQAWADAQSWETPDYELRSKYL